MPNLADSPSNEFTKLIYIGDSSTGKTGSLVSLLKAGYRLRILDMDDGLEPVIQWGRKEGADLSLVEYERFRDKITVGPAGPRAARPTAFVDALKQLTTWGEIEDPQGFTVLDTLTTFSKAAFNWARGLNPTAKDPRQWYGAAQAAVEDTLAMLTSPDYKQNVIVISHVNYKELTEGVHKGYVQAVGTALGPTIPKYFNTLILAERDGIGSNVKRKIKTMPTNLIDLKVPVPEIQASYDLSTGLAEIVAQLKKG